MQSTMIKDDLLNDLRLENSYNNDYQYKYKIKTDNYRIIQKNNQTFKDIRKDIINVKKAGFDAILIGPIQPLKEDTTFEFYTGKKWWLAYQPCGFRIGNQIVGTKKELEELIYEAHRHGIRIIVDAVVNHVAGGTEPGKYLELNENVDSIIKDNERFMTKRRKFYYGCYNVLRNNWNDEGFVREFIKNWKNRNDVITGCPGGVVSLNTYEDFVQNLIFNFMNELEDLGVDGFRIDAAKNIALPIPGEDCTFFDNLNIKLHKTKLNENPFIFSEVLYWDDPEKVRQYGKYTHIFTDNKEVNDTENYSIGCIESHDQYFQPEDFGFTVLDEKEPKDVEEYGKRYFKLTSRKNITLLYVRPCDYFKVREIYDKQKELENENNREKRLKLQNEINELKESILYYKEFIKKANLVNSPEKKTELDFYDYMDSVDYRELNTVLYKYNCTKINELDNLTSKPMSKVCKWIINNYNFINKDNRISPKRISREKTDNLVEEFLSNINIEYAKLYNEWKTKPNEIAFFYKSEDELRKSCILNDGSANIDLKGNINDVSEIVYQVMQKIIIKKSEGKKNKDMLNKVIAMSTELLVKDFLNEKGYNIDDKIRTRYNRVFNYAKTINFENNLINCFKDNDDITPHYMYEYCVNKRKNLALTFENKEAIHDITRITQTGELYSSKASKYVVGGILAPKIHNNIKSGKLKISNLVNLIEHMHDYDYYKILNELGVDLTKLTTDEGINEFVQPFNILKNELEQYQSEEIKLL